MQTYFWAKTTLDDKLGASVEEHSLKVGEIAFVFAKEYSSLLEKFALSPAQVAFLAATHDIGKIFHGFQSKSQTWLDNNNFTAICRNNNWSCAQEIRHENVSLNSLKNFLSKHQICQKNGIKYWSTIVAYHHSRRQEIPSRISQTINTLHEESKTGIKWEEERQALLYKLWERYDKPRLPDISAKNHEAWFVAGLITLADWLGSDENYSLSPEKDLLSSVGLAVPKLQQQIDFTDVFEIKQLNEMQEKTYQYINAPGIYILEASMGMGKTEAALMASYKLMTAGLARGIYFALPTQATSNRIYLRLQKFVDKICQAPQAVQLIHSNSWLLKDFTALSNIYLADKPAQNWFTSAKRALFSPFGVGTIDQVLLATIPAKHFFLRRFALAQKVIIIDELHSYDLYTGSLIDELCQRAVELGCTIIILSATLNHTQKQNILKLEDDNNYPLLCGKTNVSLPSLAITPPKDKVVNIYFKDEDTAIRQLIEQAKSGAQVIYICNTVSKAQYVYNKIKTLTPSNDFELGLLHSRFPFFRREQLEEHWLEKLGKNGNRERGSILISTQIVEQSVDLDADLLLSELAPTDLLLQRMGRLWRHDRQRPVKSAEFWIITESVSLAEFKNMSVAEIEKALGGKAFVYKPYLLLRTLELWASLSKVIIPKDIRKLIDDTYFERDECGAWQEFFVKKFGNDLALKAIANRKTNIWDLMSGDAEGTHTRIGELPTYNIILCKNIVGNEIILLDTTKINIDAKIFELHIARALAKNIVKIPCYVFNNLQNNSLLKQYSADDFAILEDDTLHNKYAEHKYKLMYDEEIGFSIMKPK